MEWVKTTGKTVPQAIEQALDTLGVDESEAEIVVIEEPRTGLFGRIKGTARVEARIKPVTVRPKADRRNRRGDRKGRNRGNGRGRSDKRNGGGNNKKGASAKQSNRRDSGGRDSGGRDSGGRRSEANSGQKNDSGRNRSQNGSNGNRNSGDQRQRSDSKAPAQAQGADRSSGDGSQSNDGQGSSNRRNRRRGGRGGENRQTADEKVSSETVSSETVSTEAAVAATAVAGGAAVATASGKDAAESTASNGGNQRPKRKKPNRSDAGSKPTEEIPVEHVAEEVVADHLKDFLGGLTTAFGLEGDVSIDKPEPEVMVASVDGRHGLMVGPKGRTLEAIQELARVSAQRSAPSAVRIRVDVGGYRQQRSEAIAAFAVKAADKAVDNSVEVKLDPMPASDRKAVHDALTEDSRVETRSIGTDPRRRVLIVPMVSDASDGEEE